MRRIASPATQIDFYKAGHYRQYPDGTTLVVSNLTPRSGKHANLPKKDGIIFFGLQYFLKDFLIDSWQRDFFDKPMEIVVPAYKRRMDTALGPAAISVKHIEDLHALGYMPIEIKALPEGSFVPVGVPCLTLHNTRPEFFWLTNYIETVLSSYLWLPCTSATTAFNYRMTLEKYAKMTGSDLAFVDWQGHDFSFRGMSSPQSAMMSGAGHLVFFTGTDTVPAIDFVEAYYNGNAVKELIGGSVPATEHSVMSMGGELDEIGTFRRLVTKLYPAGIISIVSDTWDFWKVITEYSKTLKPEIMARTGKVVFRPDSGNPADILCGNPNAPQGTPERMGAVEGLWDIFGGTTTETGHKLLDSHVGLIYGDSITCALAEEIMRRLETKGFASGNVVLGVGSYTYQFVTRDTWGFAVKATYGEVNGEKRDIYKNPKTDSGVKKSARGLLVVNKDKTLTQQSSWDDYIGPKNSLKTVFRNGQITDEQTFANIRKIAKKELNLYV